MIIDQINKIINKHEIWQKYLDIIDNPHIEYSYDRDTDKNKESSAGFRDTK